MKKTVAVICAGGPAPGINTVVSTVAKVFLKDDYRVLGVHYGYQGLFSDETGVVVRLVLTSHFVLSWASVYKNSTVQALAAVLLVLMLRATFHQYTYLITRMSMEK